MKYTFNKKIEFLIGMMLLIGSIVLSEFAEDPEQIGIQNMTDLA
jgi:hypothetical protein